MFKIVNNFQNDNQRKEELQMKKKTNKQNV